jgi:hypothetical protein
MLVQKGKRRKAPKAPKKSGSFSSFWSPDMCLISAGFLCESPQPPGFSPKVATSPGSGSGLKAFAGQECSCLGSSVGMLTPLVCDICQFTVRPFSGESGVSPQFV